MLLRDAVEDLSFSFDFWGLFAEHLDPEFSGFGSTSPVHVIKYERREGSTTPHISYKYWSQSQAWLPEDGSSLRILRTRPTVSDFESIAISKYPEEMVHKMELFQKPVLRFLNTRL